MIVAEDRMNQLPRNATTKRAAKLLGFVYDDGRPNVRAFLIWAKDLPEYLQPKQAHHKWWPVKAIDEHLDSKKLTNPQSADHVPKLRQRLAQYGNHENPVRS